MALPQISNEELACIWEEASSTGNVLVLRLVREIDDLKNNLSGVRSTAIKRRETYKHEVKTLSQKRYCQGQTYMRELISKDLARAGYKKASELALQSHVKYDLNK